MQKLLFSALLGSVLVLSGCATLSESQCVASDWETVGYRDGLAGTPTSHLLKHQNACVKHGIVPDRNAYLAGWEEGVEQYCQADNGFTLGQAGANYKNICPDHLKHLFYAAYQDGRQLYLAQVEINRLTRKVGQNENRLKQIKAETINVATSLISDETSTEQRLGLLVRTRDLAQEQGQLEAEIQDLNVQIALKSERLYALRNTLASVTH